MDNLRWLAPDDSCSRFVHSLEPHHTDRWLGVPHAISWTGTWSPAVELQHPCPRNPARPGRILLDQAQYHVALHSVVGNGSRSARGRSGVLELLWPTASANWV